MSDPTKACNLTEEEIKILIGDHGRNLIDYSSVSVTTYAEEKLERINYLNKRLKAFSEIEKVEDNKVKEPVEPNLVPASVPPTTKAWS